MTYMRQAKNVLFCSSQGALFKASVDKSTSQVFDDAFFDEVFKGRPYDYAIMDAKHGFEFLGKVGENVRIYYEKGSQEIWNYNPIITAYVGEVVCSNPIIFISEGELAGNDGSVISNDDFYALISGFVSGALDAIAKLESGESLDEKKEDKKPDLSKLYKLSRVAICIADDEKYKEEHSVEPGDSGDLLDSFWQSYYVGRYVPEFTADDCPCYDVRRDETTNCMFLSKPHQITFLDKIRGIVSIYFTGYTHEMYYKVFKEIQKIDKDLDKDKRAEAISKIWTDSKMYS